MLNLARWFVGSNPNSARSSTGNLLRPHPKLNKKKRNDFGSLKKHVSKSLVAFQTDTKQGSNRMSFLPAKVKAAKLNAASVVANASKTSKGVSHPITKNPEKPQKTLKAL